MLSPDLQRIMRIRDYCYANISLDIIWETAANDIPALKRFCEEQLSGESKN